MDLYTHYITPMISWLGQHPNWAGLFTFLISFSESLAIVGTIVPGSVTMTAIGMLVGTGVLPLTSTFIWAILGAIAGDSASYYLGYFYRDKITNIWPFRTHPKMLENGQHFFNQHGSKSVFIGRFLGPLRSIIPVIAGIMRMPNSLFLTANITSAILWSFLYILPGMLIGNAASELSTKVATKFFITILLALLAIWLLAWAVQYLYCIISNYINTHLYNFWQWLHQHPRLERWAMLISNPQNPRDHKQIILLLAAILSMMLFIFVAISAAHKGIITHWDKQTLSFLKSVRQPAIEVLFMFFTFIGDKKTLIPLLFGLFFYFVAKKQKCEAVHWLSNGIVSAILVYILKPFFSLARPSGLVLTRHGFSFPSGHTTFSIAVFGFLFYLIAKHASKEMRRFIIIPGMALIACIAFSRIYLSMHWLSDIIGSAFLASSILLLHILSYQKSKKNGFSILQVSLTALSLVLIVSSFFIYRDFRYAMLGVQLKHTHQLTTINDWWQGNYHLPRKRPNRFGNHASTLNLQVAMPLSQIKQHFKTYGWKKVASKDFTKRFKNYILSTPDKISLFNKLYKNHPPKIVMIKGNYVLRLWSAHVAFRYNKTPLWVGTLSHIKHESVHLLHNDEDKKNNTLANNESPSVLLSKELAPLTHKVIQHKGIEIIMIKEITPINHQ